MDEAALQFPVSATAGPGIESAGNGKQKKRHGEQRKISVLSASDLRERNKALERHRRRSMKQLFHTLHSLLPYHTPKRDQASILDEMIKYIPLARTKLEDLRKAKALLLDGSIGRTSDETDLPLPDLNVNAAVRVDGNEVEITVWRANKWVPLLEILNELEAQGLELINCSSFVNDAKFFHHLKTKCLDASVLSCDSLQSALYKIGSTPPKM